VGPRMEPGKVATTEWSKLADSPPYCIGRVIISISRHAKPNELPIINMRFFIIDEAC
jgi:hypothetical protein